MELDKEQIYEAIKAGVEEAIFRAMPDSHYILDAIAVGVRAAITEMANDATSEPGVEFFLQIGHGAQRAVEKIVEERSEDGMLDD